MLVAKLSMTRSHIWSCYFSHNIKNDMGTRHNYAKQTSSENKISCLLEKGSSEQWDCFEEKYSKKYVLT